MTFDQKSKFRYRIFVGLICIAVGFTFYWIPLANIKDSIVKGTVQDFEVGLTLPVMFIVVGMGILIGIFDWCLDFALGFKTAFKKARKQG